MHHLDAARIQELALDPWSGDDRARAVAHAACCARCGRAVAMTSELWSQLALALPPCPPSARLRARLLAATEGPLRYAPFIARVAALFAVDEARATSLLTRAAEPASYRAAGVEGMTVASADVGESLGRAHACFLRAAPGARWPLHEHDGEEHVLVLEGAFREDGGHEAHAGDLERSEPGSRHAFVALDASPCVCAVLTTGPVRLVR